MLWYCDEPNMEQFTREHEDDAGFDIATSTNVAILDKGQVTIPTGLHVAIPKDHVGIIKPRSGLSKRLGTDALAGVVDAGYRGEVMVVLTVRKPPVYFKRGDKIAQMIIVKRYMGEVTRVNSLEELGETDRGDNGFGSTGGIQ